MNYKSLNRIIVAFILASCFFISLFLIIKAYNANQWETIAASLAVVAAVLATSSSLKIIWRQEDDLEPEIVLQFDLDSRSRAIQLLIKNAGGQDALDIEVFWDKPLRDFSFNELQIPKIPVLLKGETYRFFVGESVETFTDARSKSIDLYYSGKISYKQRLKQKRKSSNPFQISLEAYRRKIRPISDQQNFYLENVSFTKELQEIKALLKGRQF